MAEKGLGMTLSSNNGAIKIYVLLKSLYSKLLNVYTQIIYKTFGYIVLYQLYYLNKLFRRNNFLLSSFKLAFSQKITQSLMIKLSSFQVPRSNNPRLSAVKEHLVD